MHLKYFCTNDRNSFQTIFEQLCCFSKESEKSDWLENMILSYHSKSDIQEHWTLHRSTWLMEQSTQQSSWAVFGLLSQFPLPLRPLLPFSSPPPLSVSQTACAGFIRPVCQQMMMLGVHLLQCLENSAFKRFYSKVSPVPITKTERVNEWMINPLVILDWKTVCLDVPSEWYETWWLLWHLWYLRKKVDMTKNC